VKENEKVTLFSPIDLQKIPQNPTNPHENPKTNTMHRQNTGEREREREREMHTIVDVTVVAGIGVVILASGILEELEDRAVPPVPSTAGLVIIAVSAALSLAGRGLSDHLLPLPRHSSDNG
jgi:hypothetical protein